jgi:DNA-binding transcriptional regulator YiaG
MANIALNESFTDRLNQIKNEMIEYHSYVNIYPSEIFSYTTNYSEIIKKQVLEKDFRKAFQIAKQLSFSDKELAERFNVSISTFQSWSEGVFPFPSIQKEFVLFVNCARIEIIKCNQCDKKRIPSEVRRINLRAEGSTCLICLGEKIPRVYMDQKNELK